MDRQLLARILATAGAGLVLLAMLTPWWTAEYDVEGSFVGVGEFSESGDLSAKPFDDGVDGDEGLIKASEAVTAGIVVLLALLASAASAALAWLGKEVRLAGLLAAGSGLLMGLAVILALTTWPSDDIGFWDSATNTSGGVTSTLDTYAHFGWYTAAVTALVGLVTAFFLLTSSPGGSAATARTARDEETEDQKPASASSYAAAPPLASAPPAARTTATAKSSSGRCSALTKSGVRCARSATTGTFCSVHASSKARPA